MTPPITLRIPHRRPYHGIARLVVGGLAARLELSYEHLEDLQLALSSVLERNGYVLGPDVTVELDVGESALALRIGPVRGDELRAALAEEKEPAEGLTLGRLLTTVVEDVSFERRDDGEWLRLEKAVRIVQPQS